MSKKLITIIVLGLTFGAQGQNLESIADSLRIKNNIPELGYSVISSDSIFEMKIIGYNKIDQKNEENKAEMSDYFHLGSNTKAITGFVAAWLVEQNQIEWSTKFFDLFPAWQKKSKPEYYQITLKDLLSHRARIQPYTSGIEFQKLPDFEGSKSEQRKHFAQFILEQKPVILGKDDLYHYSNAGYTLAALMLEKVSGKDWEKLVERLLSKKLGLSYEIGWPNRYNINQPWGHWIENNTLKPVSPNTDYNLMLIEPAGDISMTLPDYSKFIQLNLKGLKGKNNILKSSTYNFLHFGLPEYSIGWENVNTENNQFSKHAGSDGTFFAVTLVDKKNDLAYIILMNTATNKAQNGLFYLLEEMREKYDK